ncbi:MULTISPECIES: DNA polymerase III subunit gamma/tau [Thalassospira]|jgi:DNA polymerase-3 subunit gamma/tau|uniref:DNA polymerase III subunit gamma/tau n=1 Tax=Thalassospira xiamenensis TaxID=220697 RepID=A0ABR5Y786_9PROT|nr:MULTISPECIES: DNA polymerase III subunit gamma/tau [Thalassospira]MAL28780.1 DNA polymerase III subunit gamma/tau [Thalassospira sp.]MBR9780502.1 DNA polymerase III subunit gamma/tau [Rhodospirillales bacterium]KZD07219.1 DNA polymerase III subunit gamma/tau [Thalassospira xiamenensis]KZD09485.1 DNA polymerase III subunit gamma/tau [Thalassospira xiamenensis]MBL4841965.1 DNA polymerase III subunit gamma/tau [Thalassospira sp.]|tara:strand:- start:1181 stop:3079 length:1899 start_codon:yes stop_codon:yes gene_type:complete
MTDQIDNAETSAPETPEAEAPELDMEQEPAAAAPASVTAPKAEEAPKSEYQVLARKYRPKTFDELIGHGPMVKTLSNALESGRLAHAFVLTGVRGIGKTTTARIIARALNCIGPDGKGNATIEPCGVCEHCRAIAEDRHVDVLEMDAASRTGVDDIRELIEGVRYRPTSARYKIYIIDEVHMLSKSAFNALLKTLEEPPEHVKFIFATTEIRKIPITVLSRCQRFDLRRVQTDELAAHYKRIATLEHADIEDEALALIARAADGSVRDGMSLLDQAISHGAGKVTTQQVRDMLGLSDRSRIFDLFDRTMKGEINEALELLGAQYALGGDPAVMLQDMLDLTHWLTRVKLSPEAANDPGVSQIERDRGKEIAAKLAMPQLTRAWQMLLKGLEETRIAPSPIQAAEMILIRLAYAAEMPPPGDLIKKLRNDLNKSGNAPQGGGGNGGGGPGPRMQVVNGGGAAVAHARPDPLGEPEQAPQQVYAKLPETFAEVAELLSKERETTALAIQLKNYMHLVKYEPGRIEFRPARGARADLSSQLIKTLNNLTGHRWLVSVSEREEGAPTLKEQELEELEQRKADASLDPLVKAILDGLPKAKIVAVHLPPGQEETEGEQDDSGSVYDDAFYLEGDDEL